MCMHVCICLSMSIISVSVYVYRLYACIFLCVCTHVCMCNACVITYSMQSCHTVLYHIVGDDIRECREYPHYWTAHITQLEVLHTCCNTDMFRVLLIYLNSSLGPEYPWKLCIQISQTFAAMLQYIIICMYVCMYAYVCIYLYPTEAIL